MKKKLEGCFISALVSSFGSRVPQEVHPALLFGTWCKLPVFCFSSFSMGSDAAVSFRFPSIIYALFNVLVYSLIALCTFPGCDYNGDTMAHYELLEVSLPPGVPTQKYYWYQDKVPREYMGPEEGTMTTCVNDIA